MNPSMYVRTSDGDLVNLATMDGVDWVRAEDVFEVFAFRVISSGANVRRVLKVVDDVVDAIKEIDALHAWLARGIYDGPYRF